MVLTLVSLIRPHGQWSPPHAIIIVTILHTYDRHQLETRDFPCGVWGNDGSDVDHTKTIITLIMIFSGGSSEAGSM